MAVYVDKRMCKGCKICLFKCNKDVFEMSKDVNQTGYNYAVAKNQENCVKCMLCEKYCPDFAIRVE